jgi:hypothetical protein
VLGWLFTHTDERFFVRQLASLLDLDSTNLSRELARLEKIGLLVSETSGKQKYYQANEKSPIFSDLKSIVRKTFDVPAAIPEPLDVLAHKDDIARVRRMLDSAARRCSSIRAAGALPSIPMRCWQWQQFISY